MLRGPRIAAFGLLILALLVHLPVPANAQAALLMEEPYGFFGALNPTGHTALYFARICAETPVKLRHCEAGEQGVVIARYQGIGSYDWIAIPVVPYLYSVEDAGQVPDRVDRETVTRLRDHYREKHLYMLGDHLPGGNLLRGGWKQLVGVAYERRVYAFRFDTTEQQDDALIDRLNLHDNRSEFDLLFNNCADFARAMLNVYFPRTFGRAFFPDAGMTTPKQITYKLVRYAKKHPETNLEVYEIPQIPGYRRQSRSNKSVAASLVTTGYAIPIAMINPYLAGGIFVDYLVRGRYPLIPKHPELLEPDKIQELTAWKQEAENPESPGIQTPSVSMSPFRQFAEPSVVNTGAKELVDAHE